MGMNYTCTSMDEEDVVLTDWTMNHVWVRLASQQMLIEPLTAILEGLSKIKIIIVIVIIIRWRRGRKQKRKKSHTAQHFPQLIATPLRFSLLVGFFVSTKSAFTAEILICNTEMRLWPISIIYAFVLWALEVEWRMSWGDKESLFPLRPRGMPREESGDEIKFTG